MSAASILTALFNGAWQGAVLCATAYCAFRLVGRLNAATMFAAWAAVWAMCLALPVANFFFAAEPYTAGGQAMAQQQRLFMQRVSIQRTPTLTLWRTEPRFSSRAQALPAIRSLAAAALRGLLANAAIVLWTFAAFAAFRIVIVGRDVLNMMAARRRVIPIRPPVDLPRSFRRPFEFASSAEFSSPCVLGFSPAFIIIPENILLGSKDQFLSVALHECEHVRRFDDVQNVVTRVVDALAFFCPGVLIAARQLTLFRERICDDAAIVGTGDAVSYATTLAEMAAWPQTSRTPVPCLVFARKHLLHRVHVLLDSATSHSLQLNRRFAFTATVVLAIAAAFVLHVQVPVIAEPPGQAQAAVAFQPQPVDIDHHVHDNGGTAEESQTFSGTFALARCAPAGQIRLRLVYRHVAPHGEDSDDITECASPSEFHGITIENLASSVARRTFAIARDAGTIQADGQVGDGHGSGTWTFVPNSSLATELDRRGLGHPSPQQQFELAIDNFHIATLDMLLRNDFARPSVVDLVRIGEVGVTNDLIQATLSLPTRPKTVGELTRLAEVGATPAYIAGLKRLGYSPSMEEVIRLTEVAVTPAYIAGLERLGYHPSAKELIRLKEVGVTPSSIERLHRRAYAHPSINDLIRMQEQGF